MKLNILLLEDDPKLANEIRQYFLAKNNQCDIAYDGQAVFKLIPANKYDILILDINVPTINGLEVCRRIRIEDKSTPILMLTAFGDVNDKVDALNIGAMTIWSNPSTLMSSSLVSMHSSDAQGNSRQILMI